MDLNIEERKENPLLKRKEIKGTVGHAGEATPSEESLEKLVSEELGIPEEDIKIDNIFTIHGTQKSRFKAKEFGAKKQTESKESKSSPSQEEDYKELLDGSIADAKEKIDDMDDPDFELLMEVEEENKDRKGMKKFLESKIGE